MAKEIVLDFCCCGVGTTLQEVDGFLVAKSPKVSKWETFDIVIEKDEVRFEKSEYFDDNLEFWDKTQYCPFTESDISVLFIRDSNNLKKGIEIVYKCGLCNGGGEWNTGVMSVEEIEDD